MQVEKLIAERWEQQLRVVDVECCQSGKDVKSILVEYRNGLQHWENFNKVFVSQKCSQ
jgi:hypothetical protein